jgi:hypothetical protein
VIEDRQSGLPGCWFQGPLEIGVSNGPRYLRSLFGGGRIHAPFSEMNFSRPTLRVWNTSL